MVQHPPEELARILSTHETRKLSKNLTRQFENRLYQIELKRPDYTLRGAAHSPWKKPVLVPQPKALTTSGQTVAATP